MRLIFLTLLAFLILINISGQKTELNISLNSGLYSYSGISAQSATSINYNDQTKSGYTNNSYGSKDGICYGLSLNIKRVTTRNFILGLAIGYESLRSKVSIDRIDGYNGTSTYQYGATGHTFLNNDNLNLNPFLGYRINVKAISFDLSGGFDIAYILKSTENGNATATNGIKYSTTLDKTDRSFDFRPRIQFSADYKRYGLYVGYSYGLINYMMWAKGDAVFEVYSRLFRFGVTYEIN